MPKRCGKTVVLANACKRSAGRSKVWFGACEISTTFGVRHAHVLGYGASVLTTGGAKMSRELRRFAADELRSVEHWKAHRGTHLAVNALAIRCDEQTRWKAQSRIHKLHITCDDTQRVRKNDRLTEYEAFGSCTIQVVGRNSENNTTHFFFVLSAPISVTICSGGLPTSRQEHGDPVRDKVHGTKKRDDSWLASLSGRRNYVMRFGNTIEHDVRRG